MTSGIDGVETKAIERSRLTGMRPIDRSIGEEHGGGIMSQVRAGVNIGLAARATTIILHFTVGDTRQTAETRASERGQSVEEAKQTPINLSPMFIGPPGLTARTSGRLNFLTRVCRGPSDRRRSVGTGTGGGNGCAAHGLHAPVGTTTR